PTEQSPRSPSRPSSAPAAGAPMTSRAPGRILPGSRGRCARPCMTTSTGCGITKPETRTASQTVEATTMERDYRRIDALRRGLPEIETDLIDELAGGRIGRREFLRHGTVLGLSLPLLGGVLGGMGLAMPASPARAAGKPGGTIRVTTSVPAGAIDPVTVDD